jgi:signal transduction histidine kinase
VGPYVALNAVFIGLYGFSAIYHVVLWSQSRRESVLLVFALHSALCCLLSVALIALSTAVTPADGQRALDIRVAIAALVQIPSVWLLSLLTAVRARWYVWFITVGFLTVVAVHFAIAPITGTVTSVEHVSTWWGVISILRRESPSPWIGVIYAVSLSINVFGYVCAWRQWTRDRVGGALIALANSGGVVVGLWALRIDVGGSSQPYLGAIHYPVWVLLMASQIARNYRLRVDQRNQALQALEHSREELRQLTAGLLMAREEERTAIAREIHDVLGQTLTALKMDVAWIGARSPADAPAAIRQKLTAMTGLIDDTIVTVRRIATGLRPGVLDDFGLAAAVEWQAQEFEQRTGIHCALRTNVGEATLDPLLSTALFRILQESLTNVARHSRASRVSVALEHSGTDLVLEVRDDGVGITAADAAAARSIGLAGMRERAQLVGGSVFISGAAGAGTTVRVQVPRRDARMEPGQTRASSPGVAEAL